MEKELIFYFAVLPFFITAIIVIDLHFAYKARFAPNALKRTIISFSVFILTFILYYFKAYPIMGFEILIIYLCLTRMEYKHITFIFLLGLIMGTYFKHYLFPLYMILIMLSYNLYINKHKEYRMRVFLINICSIVLLNLELFIMQIPLFEVLIINGTCIFFWTIISVTLVYFHVRKGNYEKCISRKYYDQITKIPNYHSLVHDTDMLLKKKGQIGLLLINIDRLKDINKLYGNDLGDKVLIEVATIINELVQDFGKVYRLSGDSFCVIATNENYQRVKTMSEKIRLTIEIKELFYDNNKIKLNVSIGGYCGNAESNKIDDYLEIAQESLVGSKMAGRNRIVINNRMVVYS